MECGEDTEEALPEMPLDKVPTYHENGEVATEEVLPEIPLDKVPTYHENGEVVTEEALPEFNGELPDIERPTLSKNTHKVHKNNKSGNVSINKLPNTTANSTDYLTLLGLISVLGVVSRKKEE